MSFIVMVMITAWTGATRGGSTRPLLSPCTITDTPMERVVSPQEVCQGICFSPFSSSKFILNIFPKFWPRLWLGAPWIALPEPLMYASTVVVCFAPANFSLSVFWPLITGTASSSSYTRSYRSRMESTRFCAFSYVSWAVCPSCQRNSLERRKGVASLNSHRTTLLHWFSSIGRSRWLRIHFAKKGYMMVSEVGRMAIGSASSVVPDLVTHATSGANPSRWSFSVFSARSLTNSGK
mmetsp:Transcript_10588/g.23158  ORF Transcript_10588/g.23158 Transcript_10588/m.23158 type:complete len:236 (-) Transcript_10588:917-1624(-)